MSDREAYYSAGAGALFLLPTWVAFSVDHWAVKSLAIVYQIGLLGIFGKLAEGLANEEKKVKKLENQIKYNGGKMNSERTTNLKKYYNFIYTCKKCKRLYGSDIKEKEKDRVCPECLGELK